MSLNNLNPNILKCGYFYKFILAKGKFKRDRNSNLTLSVKFVIKQYFKILIFKNIQNIPTTGLTARQDFYKFLEINLTSFGHINQKI